MSDEIDKFLESLKAMLARKYPKVIKQEEDSHNILEAELKRLDEIDRKSSMSKTERFIDSHEQITQTRKRQRLH